MTTKRKKVRNSLKLDGNGFVDVVGNQGLDIGHSDFLIDLPPDWWDKMIEETTRRENERTG